MRVLVAGATGVVGRALVPLLVGCGHDVVGLSRSRPDDTGLTGPGTVTRVAVDALDRDAVARAVDAAAPDAVVHLLTAIPDPIDPRRLDRDLAATNRLRTEGTAHLLDAARRAGVRRVITQSLAFVYDPESDTPADEDTPLWRRPPRPFAPALRAVEELERRTTDAAGLVLRFGHLYGPGTTFAPDGATVGQVRARRFPVVGRGTATFSFLHAHDAAGAVVAALDRAATGVLNVVDDDPTPVATWLPALAALLDAPPPGRVPTVAARLVAGSWGVAFLTRLRGADNARARLQLDWRPRYGSWRDGFVAELGSAAGRTAAREAR